MSRWLIAFVRAVGIAVVVIEVVDFGGGGDPQARGSVQVHRSG